MSGASALAAAKRRRGVGSEPSRPIQSKPTQNQNQMPRPPPPVATQGQAQTQNPLYVLLQHEQKLDNLEKSLNLMKISDKKEDVLTPDSLAYFKTQHELMSKEIQELKKIIIKVQTFSMETNLDLLKIKKTLKLIDSNEVIENSS